MYNMHTWDIINDCDNNNGKFNQICVNTDRNFIFECKTGYQLNDNLMTCSGMYSVLPRIFRVVIGF